MRTLAVDGRTGASGDMLLAALLDAGADRAALAPVEDALAVRYDVRDVERAGIEATSVDVVLATDADDDHDPVPADDHAHADSDDHGHAATDDHAHAAADDHGHSHDHADGATHAEGAGPVRHYDEVLSIVGDLDLPDGVESDARAVFERLGEAEAAVHGTDLEDVHFHEVGADDAIADVVGVALLLDDLGVDRVLTTPIFAGGGEVAMDHGTYPVPAPAVAELAADADWELRGGPVDEELLTPTGAAILAHYAAGADALPLLSVDATGYGAGDRDLPDRPNVVRVLVGDGGGLARDDVTVLETNLDDATPEVLGDLQRSLTAAGARDVSIVPLTMKESRPGHLVKVICDPADAERLAHRLARETGTLGVREHGAGHRWVAERTFETATIESDGGETFEVAVKIASDADGTVFDVSAEYADAADVAQRTELPVRDVMRRAEAAVRARLDDPGND